jgi:exopolyphosphatase / guanosine-5'-triphosphate,3'-diphosphate pyrophosphatase
MPEQQHVAIIDLGSNTARVVVMSAAPGYSYRLEDEIREVVRLRQGMDDEGLAEEAMRRGFATLRLFKRFCDDLGADPIIATATSAVRDAANGAQFVSRVQTELGLKLRVLDGEREAYYGTIGALNDVALSDGAVLDIGGGSAQISLVRGRRYVRGQSAPIGALALTDQLIKHDPIKDAEFKAVRKEIECQLDKFDWLNSIPGQLVGLGGTIRNLARIEAARQEYPLSTLHGFELTLASVEESIEQFRTLPLNKRLKVPGLHSDRADIILAGALAIEAIMARMTVDRLTVAVNGLREGLFYEYFWGHLVDPVISDIRSFGVLNLARVYRYQKTHANHVRFLAGRMFDQLAPLHGYGAGERELLEAAALLHDIGTAIGYDAHHEHSQTLITNAGLPGFSPREIALIALLARYHRKGTPSTGAYASVLAEGDDLLLVRLAAILRLSEYLERGRTSAVDDVAVSWAEEAEGRKVLRLTLIADEYPAVEIWQTRRNAVDLMERAYEREVMIDSTAPPGQMGRT